MRRHIVVLLGIGLACAGVAWGLSALSGRARPANALAAAPEGASLVLSVEMPALLASPIWRALVDEDGAGLARIEEDCGFDPLERLRTVTVFVLGTEERPFERVGFLARGELPHEQLVACVERVVGEDGGAIRRVEIEGVPAIASENGPSRAAFVRDDGIAGGDELAVREVLRVDRGDAQGADTDAALSRMWQLVRGRGEVVLVGHVPPNWREWLGRIGADADVDALDRVRTIGLGAQIRSGLGITLALQTGSEASARALVSGIREKIEMLLEDPLVRLSAAGGTLRRVQLDSRDADALLTLDLDEERLSSMVELARDLIHRRREAAERPRAARPQPDETLRPAGQ